MPPPRQLHVAAVRYWELKIQSSLSVKQSIKEKRKQLLFPKPRLKQSELSFRNWETERNP